MEILEYQIDLRNDVHRLRDRTFAELNEGGFLWRPCQQTESLDRDGIKLVGKEAHIIAYAASYPLDETHSRLNLLVDPCHRRQGKGTQLLEKIETHSKSRGIKYLQARLHESMEGNLNFARARGFQEIHRMRGMSMHAHEFRRSEWHRLQERLLQKGFSVSTMAQEETAGNDPLTRLVELQKVAEQGWPSPDPTQSRDTSDDGIRRLFTEDLLADLIFIVKYNGLYVGFSGVNDRQKPRPWTAVHPDFRGQGIATFVKGYSIQECLKMGATYFESSSANPALHRVNERLGYRFNGLAEVRFLKSF